MHIRFLKIKLKALAAEARIIRREELRTNCSPRIGEVYATANTLERAALHEHRVGAVRREARHTYLAYGFLRGRAYAQLEVTCQKPPDLSAVLRMVRKYGASGTLEEGLRDWVCPQAERKVA